MEQKQLFIPTKMQKDSIFGKGFGKSEMRRTSLFVVVGVALGLLTGLVFFNDNFQTIAISVVSVGGFVTGIGYFICVKMAINLSIYDYISIMKKFFSSQRQYSYIKLKEWY